MALSAATVLEVRTGGSDSNGGGFVTGASGTDRSQQTAAHATLTAASTVHTTTTQINVAGGDYTVTAADVGNLLQITGGTATAGFYEITAADVPNNRWTVDRSAGTAGQTVVGAMGGALASPGKASGAITVAGMIAWVDDGTYSITSTTSNVSNGRVTLGVANTRMIGYEVTRGDDTGTRPLFSAGVNTMTMVTLTNDSAFGNINGTAASATGIAFVTSSSQGLVYKCKMTGANATAAFTGGTSSTFILCEATGGTVAGFSGTGGHFVGCVASAIAARGFNLGTGDSTCHRCISINNTGGTGKGFDFGSATATGLFVNCTAFGNSEPGFDSSAGPAASCNWISCLSYDNTGNGFNSNGRAWNCAAGSNATDFHANVIQINTVTLTASPFTNSGSGDFSLNNTAGGGAACRNVGLLGAFPSLISTTGFLDIGAVQHEDSGDSDTTVSSLHFLIALPREPVVENQIVLSELVSP